MVNIENEAQARQIIDTKLREAGWVFTGTDRNVLVESATISDGTVGRADYMLLNSKGHPLCIIEAKKPEINPLSAKEQARRYAESQNIRLVIFLAYNKNMRQLVYDKIQYADMVVFNRFKGEMSKEEYHKN